MRKIIGEFGAPGSWPALMVGGELSRRGGVSPPPEGEVTSPLQPLGGSIIAPLTLFPRWTLGLGRKASAMII